MTSENNEIGIDKAVHVAKKERTRKSWNQRTNFIKQPIFSALLFCAKVSAVNPIATVIIAIMFALSIFIIGGLSNFKIETSERILFIPVNSVTEKHNELVDADYAQGDPSASVRIIVHANEENVLTLEGMERTFEALDTIRNMTTYQELCVENNLCSINSVTNFWSHNYTVFKNEIKTEEQLKTTVSQFQYPDGYLVNRDYIIGNPKPSLTVQDIQSFIVYETLLSSKSNTTATKVTSDSATFTPDAYETILGKAGENFKLKTLESYFMAVTVPRSNGLEKLATAFEMEGTAAIVALTEKWSKDSNYSASAMSSSLGKEESLKSLAKDAPLMLCAFLIMTVFCIFSLSRKHKVRGHGLLGIGAVFSIILSIGAGYGFLFIIGVPLSPLSYLFPYAMIGFGLDDTFLFTDSFLRMDSNEDVVKRVEKMIEEVGLSASTSSITTIAAFLLGTIARTSAIRWFCFYAIVTVSFTFLYQITFFVALMVLDTRRINSGRKQFLICFKAKTSEDDNGMDAANSSSGSRIMQAYHENLLKPNVKMFVLFFFALLTIGLFWIATGISNYIDGRELYSKDSVARRFYTDMITYAGHKNAANVYFRDVDFSDENVQQEMYDFVNDIVDTPYVSSQPFLFWLRDFDIFLKGNIFLETESFNDKIDLFLKTEPYSKLYGGDIIRDENGTMIASKTTILFDKVPLYDIQGEIDAFNMQNELTASNPVNQGEEDSKFFLFSGRFYSWEVSSLVTGEIVTTVALGLFSLFVISLIFIPHPIGAFILTPMTFLIYIESIAVFRLAGLSMNALTGVGLITCLGLVVDYSIHVCLKYFEMKGIKSKTDRVKKVLDSVGISVLKGGFTSFLGVMLLGFNSSLFFRTIFITFLAVTTLGVGHGLILLPVLLSYIGPIDDDECDSIPSQVNCTDCTSAPTEDLEALQLSMTCSSSIGSS